MLRVQYYKLRCGRQTFVTCQIDDLGCESYLERNIGEDESKGISSCLLAKSARLLNSFSSKRPARKISVAGA